MALQGVIESRVQLFQSEAGQEAQAAHIDWQDRNSAWGRQTRGGEHGAVASKHKQKLRRVCHAFASLTFRIVGQRTSRLFVNEGLYAVRFEPFQQ